VTILKINKIHGGKTMKKIIALIVVAILVLAGLGTTMAPDYFKIYREFENTGGDSSFKADTAIDGIGTFGVKNDTNTYWCIPNKIEISQGLELGNAEDECDQGDCVEISGMTDVAWTNASVDGKDYFDFDAFGIENKATWNTEVGKISTGSYYSAFEAMKDFSPPSPPGPPGGGCWSGHCPH
jgi:hypothetical protein